MTRTGWSVLTAGGLALLAVGVFAARWFLVGPPLELPRRPGHAPPDGGHGRAVAEARRRPRPRRGPGPVAARPERQPGAVRPGRPDPQGAPLAAGVRAGAAGEGAGAVRVRGRAGRPA